MDKPTPLNIEIPLDKNRYIVSETDSQGKITYCNDYFMEVSGYTREELINQPHSIVRHPDMPRVVFKLLWVMISTGHNINAVVKNLAKDGRYYWVFTAFEIRKDTDSGEVIGYHASRKSVSKHIIEVIGDLYSELLEIENKEGVDASQKYLNKFLKEKDEHLNFANLMENIHKLY